MKIQLSKIMSQGSAKFAQAHLWSLHFPNDPQFNITDFGGDVGRGIPAQSVSEPLFGIKWDTFSLAGGMEVSFPERISYLGEIDVEVLEEEKYAIQNAMMDWVHDISPDGSITIENLEKQCKQLTLRKYSRMSGKAIYQNTYYVLPSDDLLYKGSNELAWIENNLRFKVMRVIKKQNHSSGTS